MEEPPPVSQQGRPRRASNGYIHPDIQGGPIRRGSRHTLNSALCTGLVNNRSSTGSTSNQDVDVSSRPIDTGPLQPSVMNPRASATASHSSSNQVRNECTASEGTPAEEYVKQAILPFTSAPPNDVDPRERRTVTRQISRVRYVYLSCSLPFLLFLHLLGGRTM